jgi:hypothetical protein
MIRDGGSNFTSVFDAVLARGWLKPLPERLILAGTASGNRLTPVAGSANITWPHDVDEVLSRAWEPG